MRRSTLFCLLALLLFSVGYRVGTNGDGVSKIYLYGNTLIRTTPGTDITFYDLSNPKAPQLKGRIAITENSDVAVRDNFMYADNGYNLVVYNISDVGNPRAVDTVGSAFTTLPRMMPMDDVVITDVGGSSGCNTCSQETMVDAPVATGGTGTGGSLARFTIVGDRLYCIDDYSLRVFDISDPARPRYKNTVAVAWAIETIFPYNGKLFIGGREGMYIYDAADPDRPAPLSQFEHARRCDPVVVEGDYAYVTLRSTGSCGGNSNQLDVISIADIRSPKLVTTVDLAGPYGLAVRDNHVLVCDGDAGVVILDVSDRAHPRRVGGINGIVAQDIIISGNLMIVTAKSGFFLYDIGDIEHPASCATLQF